MTGPRTAASPGRRTAAITALLAIVLALVGTPVPAHGQAADPQWWHTQWRMGEVWEITEGAGVTVAVVDSGVQATVPALAGAVVAGADLVDGEVDGRSDRDEGSHGTAMAALIGARGDGFRGVAPAAEVLPVAVYDGGDLVDADVSDRYMSDGIRFAVAQGAKIINVSLGVVADQPGVDGCPEELAAAVRYAIDHDSIVVAASGNLPDTAYGFYPASCPGVLSVGATDSQLELWRRSHRGEYVDVVAPGVSLGAPDRDGGTQRFHGTSAAAALVSGALAVVWSRFPELSADRLLARVIYTARDLAAPGWDERTGHGIVRPFQALTEQVPADAPNPVWADLPELPPEAPADQAPVDQLLRPGSPAPAAGSSLRDPPVGPLVAAGVGGALLAASLVALVVLLGRRRGRSRPGRR